MIGPLFAQTAWTNVTFIGSEVRDPGRNLSRALLAGCGLVVVLYLLANVAYVATLPFEAIQHAPENRVAVAVMSSVLGRPGALAMAAAIMISTFGCNNGLILAGARVYYAMARDGLFFQRIGTINARSVPAAALIAQGLLAAFLTLPRTVFNEPGNRRDQIWERLHPTARIHRLGRPCLLRPVRFRCGRPSPEESGRGTSLSHLGVPDHSDHLGCPRRPLDPGSRLARADDVRNWVSPRFNRYPDLFCLAPRGRGTGVMENASALIQVAL